MQSLQSSAQSGVKVFKGSINDMENEINSWLAATGVSIVNVSMTYDDKGSLGAVFVIVSFKSR